MLLLPERRRFGHYRKINGGRFLLGLKDINYSDRTMRLRSLLKEGISLSESNFLRINEILTKHLQPPGTIILVCLGINQQSVQKPVKYRNINYEFYLFIAGRRANFWRLMKHT